MGKLIFDRGFDLNMDGTPAIIEVRVFHLGAEANYYLGKLLVSGKERYLLIGSILTESRVADLLGAYNSRSR